MAKPPRPMFAFMKSWLNSARESLEADNLCPKYEDTPKRDPKKVFPKNTSAKKATRKSTGTKNTKSHLHHAGKKRLVRYKVKLAAIQEGSESPEPEPGPSRPVSPDGLMDEAAVDYDQPGGSGIAEPPCMYESQSDNAMDGVDYVDIARRMANMKKRKPDYLPDCPDIVHSVGYVDDASRSQAEAFALQSENAHCSLNYTSEPRNDSVIVTNQFRANETVPDINERSLDVSNYSTSEPIFAMTFHNEQELFADTIIDSDFSFEDELAALGPEEDFDCYSDGEIQQILDEYNSQPDYYEEFINDADEIYRSNETMTIVIGYVRNGGNNAEWHVHEGVPIEQGRVFQAQALDNQHINQVPLRQFLPWQVLGGSLSHLPTCDRPTYINNQPTDHCRNLLSSSPLESSQYFMAGAEAALHSTIAESDPMPVSMWMPQAQPLPQPMSQPMPQAAVSPEYRHFSQLSGDPRSVAAIPPDMMESWARAISDEDVAQAMANPALSAIMHSPDNHKRMERPCQPIYQPPAKRAQNLPNEQNVPGPEGVDMPVNLSCSDRATTHVPPTPNKTSISHLNYLQEPKLIEKILMPPPGGLPVRYQRRPSPHGTPFNYAQPRPYKPSFGYTAHTYVGSPLYFQQHAQGMHGPMGPRPQKAPGPPPYHGQMPRHYENQMNVDLPNVDLSRAPRNSNGKKTKRKKNQREPGRPSRPRTPNRAAQELHQVHHRGRGRARPNTTNNIRVPGMGAEASGSRHFPRELNPQEAAAASLALLHDMHALSLNEGRGRGRGRLP